jgi:hypothetical protein
MSRSAGLSPVFEAASTSQNQGEVLPIAKAPKLLRYVGPLPSRTAPMTNLEQLAALLFDVIGNLDPQEFNANRRRDRSVQD